MGKEGRKLKISRKTFFFVSIALFVIVSIGIVTLSNPSLNLQDIFKQTGLAISKSGESPAQFTEGVWTDLSHTDSNGYWAWGDRIVDMTFNSNNGLIYTGIIGSSTFAGLFGASFAAYNSTSNIWIDLSSTSQGNWIKDNTPEFRAMLFNPNDGLIYTALSPNGFGVYNSSSNTWKDLSSSISSFYPKDIILDSSNEFIYAVGENGFFAKYNILSNSWTDLSSTDPSNWMLNGVIYKVESDPSTGLIYTGGQYGKLGVYDPETNIWTDLRTVELNNWSLNQSISALTLDQENNLLYLGLTGDDYGHFGIYNLSAGENETKIIDLGSTDPDNWARALSMFDITINPASNLVYTSAEEGELGVYDPETNIWTDLSATDPDNWFGDSYMNIIYSGLFNPQDNLLYFGGYNSGFGAYNESTNIWTDLRNTSIGEWGKKYTLNSIAVNPNNGLVYTGQDYLKFGVYNSSTNNWTDLSHLFPKGEPWHFYPAITEIEVNSNNDLVYFITSYGELIVYNATSNNITDLSETDPGDWASTNLAYSLAINQNDNLVYTGLASGKFGVYDPSSNVWSDLSSTDTDNWAGSNPIISININPNTNLVYFSSSDNKKWGVYDPETNISTDLSGTDFENWSDNLYVQDLAIDYDTNLVYTGFSNNRFGVYDPATNNWTPLSTLLSHPNFPFSATANSSLVSLSFNQESNLIYAGLASYTMPFIFYIPKDDTWMSLSSADPDNWVNNSGYAQVTTDPTTGLIYTGLDYGRFGAYNPSENFVEIISPSSGSTYYETNEVNFNCLAYSLNKNVSNLSLYLNGILNETVSSEDDNSLELSSSKIMTNGNWNASCVMVNSDNIQTNSSVTSFKMAVSYPSPEVLNFVANTTNLSASSTYGFSRGVEGDFGYNNGTVYYQWSVNSLNVQNETFYNVPPEGNTTSYLDYPVVKGDLISLVVTADNNYYNYSYNYSFLFGIDLVVFKTLLSEYQFDSLYCDDTYCYAGDYAGYFLKINHITGEHIYNTTVDGENDYTQQLSANDGSYINSISCDDTYCYGVDDHGYFLKINHITGEQIFNATMETPIVWSSSGVYAIDCDDTYCYGGDSAGYFLKINKTSGETVYTDVDAIQVTTTGFNYGQGTMICDETYCYAPDYTGYFLKINHVTGEQIYNTTEGYTNKLTESGIDDSIYCDETYCYAADYNGYLLKVNKLTGEQIYNTTEGNTRRLSADGGDSLFCDETYCYGGDAKGYFLKVNKLNGTNIYSPYDAIPISFTADRLIETIYCDETYCYAGDSVGYFYKLYKSPPEANETDNETEDDQGEDNNNQGGGGGGGGSSNKNNLTATSLNVSVTGNSTIITLSDSQAESGYSSLINVSDEIKLNSHNGKKNTLKLENISKDTASFIIYPSAQAFNLKKGYERKISLTEGYYDLLVRLNSIISPSEVNLTVQKIAEPILVTGSVTTSSDSNVGEETLSPEEQKKASTFLIVLVSTIVIGVGVTIVLIKTNIKPLKKKEKIK